MCGQDPWISGIVPQEAKLQLLSKDGRSRSTSSIVTPSEYDEQKVLTCRETENTTVLTEEPAY